jgi:hypothetical protein
LSRQVEDSESKQAASRKDRQHAMRRMEQADCRNGEGWYRKAANTENDGAGNRKDDVGRQQAVRGIH